MNIKPAMKVKDLKHVEYGELFLFDLDPGGCAAIKVSDPRKGGTIELLILGPCFPNGNHGPVLYHPKNNMPVPIMAFEQDYIIQFPTTAKDWHFTQPSGLDILATDGTNVYITLRDEMDAPQFVELRSGKVMGNVQSSDPLAYTKLWKIGLEDGSTFQTIVQSLELSKCL
jgi:hypothetical protein